MGKLISRTAFIFAATFFFAGNVSCGPDDVPSLEGWRAHLFAEIRDLKAVPADARDYDKIKSREMVLEVLSGESKAAQGLAMLLFMIVDGVEQIRFEGQQARRTETLRVDGR